MIPVRESIAWLRRARRVIPKEHRSVLLNPVRLALRFLGFAALRVAHRDHRLVSDDVSARDPELVDLFHEGFRILAKTYFRLQTQGVENVPATGPVLLVGNHSGALVPTEGFFTAFAIHERYGSGRALYALVHDFVFEDPLLQGYATRLGMLRASHASARHALDAGHCVLVYPGSDVDAFRPFTDRHKVVLGGRKGFLRLALRAQVPIVPVVTLGTHEQLIVLTRGDRLAKLFHAHAWARAEVFPIVLSFPWGLTSGFLPYLPLPTQVTQAFGAPIRWPELGPEAAEDPEVLERCYREVETVMQGMLDRLAVGRRFLLGRRRT